MENPDTRTIKIALDAMGGDFAPINEIEGAILANKHKGSDYNLEISFFGDEAKIKAALAERDTGGLKYKIIHTPEVVTMDDDPTEVLKTKKNSSLNTGLDYHCHGKADAFISVGNTGAVLTAATIHLGRINGVSRPTIGSFFPTQKKNPCLVLDVGANIECKPRYIFEFAVMGSIYSTQMLGLEEPSVGLLNIGEEPSKGTEVVQKTYELLKESQLNFIGNIEGRDILAGTCDVVVCDGFTGNVILKFAESFLGLLKSAIKSYAAKSILNKIAVLFVAPVLKKIFKEFDYQEYGGVPLLGVNGVVMIGHGKSSPKALSTMILKSVEFVKKDINQKIGFALNPQK